MKLSNILLVSLILFIDICGIFYYKNHYVEFLNFAIYSISIVVSLELLNKINFLQKILSLFGNILLSLFDIILIAYILGFIISFIFNIDLFNILDYLLFVGLCMEMLNLLTNKKKYGLYYPSH